MPQSFGETTVYSALSAVVAIVCTALGFKSRLDDTDKRHAELTDKVVFKDTCKTCGVGISIRLDQFDKRLERFHTEQMDLLKTVHQNLPKRSND